MIVQDGLVISVGLALRLQAAGVRWQPTRGARFVLPHRDMDEEVFVLSDLSVETHEIGSTTVLGFNGAVEWALDAVELHEAVWLPTEGQLRGLLAGTFVRLEAEDSRYTVALRVAGQEIRIEAADAVEAYGLALLHLVTGEPIATSS